MAVEGPHGGGGDGHRAELSRLWEVWRDGTVEGLRRRLIRYLRRKFPTVARDDDTADDIITQAFDSAIQVISNGKKIELIPSWFHKTVHRMAAKRLREAELLVERGVDIRSALHPDPADATYMEQERREEYLLAQALDHAERLLPRVVGTGQLKDVMDIFMEAVRKGLPDCSPSEISDVLEISKEVARELLRRGLNRLRREAGKEGIELPPELDPENHEPSGDADEEEEDV